MVDPFNRNIVSTTTQIQVVAYNRKLISEDKVPRKWEDFLRPEFKGRKFQADIRLLAVACLVPAWGLEKTLEFGRKLAAQQPLWVDGYTKALTSMVAGEHSLFLGANYSSVRRAQTKDPLANLAYRIAEPVPVRSLSRADGVLNTAEHPYAALLWLEFQAFPDGQEIIDEFTPHQASVFTPGSVVEKETRGKELSAMDWNHFPKMQDYEAKLVEAMGFPKAKTK